MLFRWVLLVLTAVSSLSLVVGRPVSLTNSVDDENEKDFVMLEGDNMTIECEEDPDYPPAVLFAQDHDRDHYHVVFFGLTQIDNDDVWTAEDVGNGTIKYTLVGVNIENAADYVCNQPRQDHPNERIAVIGQAPSCNKELDGETGETTELGHCKLDRKGDVALTLELKVVDEAGAAIDVDQRIDGKKYVEVVFNATGGFTCRVEGLDENLGVGSCQMPGAAPVEEKVPVAADPALSREGEEVTEIAEEGEVKEETDEKVPEDEKKEVVEDDSILDEEVVPPVEEEEEEEEEVVAPVEEEEEVVAPVEEEEVVAAVVEEEEEVVAPLEEVEVAEPVEGVVEEEAVEEVEEVEEVNLEEALEGVAEADEEEEVEKEEVEEELVEEAVVEEVVEEEPVEEEPVEEDAVEEVSVEEESVEKKDE